MKTHLLRAAALAALAIAISSPAAAAISLPANTVAIAGLYNTGVNAGGGVETDGQIDTHYLVNGLATVAYQHPAWVSATDAHWISQAVGGAYFTNPNVYTLTFSLVGLDAATASISGLFATDDEGFVSLNGGSPIASANAFHDTTAFSFNSGFQAGLNTLSFTVRDTGGAPAGLLVSNLKGTASVAAVPEPATWAMMIGGFGLVGATMRRRRTTVRFA